MGCETERERREEWRAKRLTRESVQNTNSSIK